MAYLMHMHRQSRFACWITSVYDYLSSTALMHATDALSGGVLLPIQ
jgi:hypothetical protein